MDNNIKVYIKEIDCEIMPRINCAQGSDQVQGIIETATKT